MKGKQQLSVEKSHNYTWIFSYFQVTVAESNYMLHSSKTDMLKLHIRDLTSMGEAVVASAFQV